ncbi:maleylpyruvate isomerase family mycothiol-dependent enzyme [Streptomyces silvisoli]
MTGPMGDGPRGSGPEQNGGPPLPRVPLPRGAAEDGPPLPSPLPATAPTLDHLTLKSLLGAWALSACSAEETAAVETHLTDCATCAEEAVRLRDAVGLLRSEDSLDLDPLLRARVLENCLGRRPARIPVPEWAGPYDAETARLDALLRDLGPGDWAAPVVLEWHSGARRASVADVIGHLTAVDGLIGAALGENAALGADAPRDPTERTIEYWRRTGSRSGGEVREEWREQGHTLLRTVSFAGRSAGGLDVSYGDFELPLRDAFVDRAFECWIHAGDIAEAVDYPYEPPAPRHLNAMLDLTARLLPIALAGRRRAGLATSPARWVEAGTPGRSVHLELEGDGGGNWFIPLDSPAAVGSKAGSVAQVALEATEFCQLAAGHREPEELAVGQAGDRQAIRDVLAATASLSRM